MHVQQAGKFRTIPESNQVSGVHVGGILVVLCTKKLHFVSWNWLGKISADYPKSLISSINEVYVIFNKISL